jgi:lipopolysaccharide transport system ATP-binding protein
MDVAIRLEGVQVDYLIQPHGAGSIKDALLGLGRRPFLERRRILHGVDLEVRRGECFGIVGRNGSGKSTLMRVVAGIVEPTAGSVMVQGRVAPMLALGVGLEPELTGLENARLCTTLLGGDRRAVQRTLAHVRDFAGLDEEHLGMAVKRYSTGMTARLGFAIATANEPEILLIDEALAVGDEGFQRKCHAHIRDLNQRGTTVLLVSHSLAEVQRICHRAACMEQGRVEIQGDPHAVGLYYHRLLGIA